MIDMIRISIKVVEPKYAPKQNTLRLYSEYHHPHQFFLYFQDYSFFASKTPKTPVILGN